MKLYLLDEDQFRKLKALASRLQGGSDRARDEGHRLWLICNDIEKQPYITFDTLLRE